MTRIFQIMNLYWYRLIHGGEDPPLSEDDKRWAIEVFNINFFMNTAEQNTGEERCNTLNDLISQISKNDSCFHYLIDYALHLTHSGEYTGHPSSTTRVTIEKSYMYRYNHIAEIDPRSQYWKRWVNYDKTHLNASFKNLLSHMTILEATLEEMSYAEGSGSDDKYVISDKMRRQIRHKLSKYGEWRHAIGLNGCDIKYDHQVPPTYGLLHKEDV